MAVYSARQSSYSDGDTITAAHTNDEFNAILAAFHVSTGHTHDGTTAGDGGPLSTLYSNAISFGTGADTDIVVTFNANTADGVITWMEDEDYFQFSDDILISTTEKIQFRDTAIYINSSTDGQLDLVADTEIQIAATTVDINGNVDVSGTLTVAGAVDFGDAALSNVGAVQLDSIAGDGDTDTSITFSGSDVITITAGGDAQVTFTNGAIVPSTNNDIDLGTSSVEFKDAFFDGTVTSDAFAGPLTGDVTGNVSGTAATVTGAAQSNITSLGTLTTLTVDNVIINGTTIGHTDDTDLMTVADGVLTVAGEVSMTTLDIGGTNVTTTAAEINLIDGGTSRGTTAVASGDGILINDGGTMRMTNVDTVSTYFASHSVGGGNIVTTGALNSGSITSGFGSIDNGSSAITTTGKVTYGSLSDGTITITAFVDEDDMSSDSATLVPTQQSVKAYVDSQSADMSFVLEDGDSTEVTITRNKEVKFVEGGGIDIDWTDTDNGTDGDPYDLTFTIDAAQTGITSVTNTSLVIGRDADNDIDFTTDNQITFRVSANDGVVFKASGEIEAASLDISGDADIDGTLEADAITVGGTALNTVIAGVTVTNATNSAHVSVADNESTNEENLIPFIEDASATGNVGLESDGDFAYNPSTGTVSATIFKGNIDADDGDFDGTLEADAITIGGTAIGSIYSAIAGSSSIVTTGALNSGSITSGFGAINNGSSAITTTGTVTFGSLADGTITVTAFVDEDDMSSDSATLVPTQQSVKAYVDSTASSAGFAVAMAIAL